MTVGLDVCIKSKMNFKNVIFIFSIYIIVSAAVKKSYDGYVLYKIVPKDDTEVKILEDIQTKNLGEFWEDAFKISGETKVMVSPENRQEFLRHLEAKNIEAKIVISDIQR